MAKIYTKNTWTDETLAGAERYDIKENGGTAFKSNMQISLATSVTVEGTPVTAAKMNNLEDGLDELDTKVAGMETNGLTAETTLADGDKFQFWKTASSALRSITYSSLKTLLGAIYAPIAKGVTNGDTHDHNGGDGGQIAHTSLSSIGTNTHAQIDTFISSINNGAWSSWTVSWTNVTVGNGTVTAKYCQIGKTVFFRCTLVFGSTTSVSGLIQVTLPVSKATHAGAAPIFGSATMYDVGTAVYQGCVILNTGDLIYPVAYKTGTTYLTGDGCTATIPHTWANTDQFYIEGFYEGSMIPPWLVSALAILAACSLWLARPMPVFIRISIIAPLLYFGGAYLFVQFLPDVVQEFKTDLIRLGLILIFLPIIANSVLVHVFWRQGDL